MKAIRVSKFGGPEELRLEEVADPRPAEGQVLLRVMAAGVNPIDAYLRAGDPRAPQPPFTPGFDAAGVVEACGPGVSAFKPGERVYAAGSVTGAYAELSVCPADRVFALPASLSFAQGAALGVPYGTAYRALFHRGRGREGELVLIHGASGGVGTAALQLCRWKGMRAAGTASTPKGRDLAKSQGASCAFDHSGPDYAELLMAWTGGRGFDLIIEMLANVNLDRDLALVAQRGRVVIVGSRGRIEIDPRATMKKDADILGMSQLNATPSELAAIHAALAEGIAAGALSPVIAEELPLDQAARAHENVMKAGAGGKIVLVP